MDKISHFIIIGVLYTCLGLAVVPLLPFKVVMKATRKWVRSNWVPENIPVLYAHNPVIKKRARPVPVVTSEHVSEDGYTPPCPNLGNRLSPKIDEAAYPGWAAPYRNQPPVGQIRTKGLDPQTLRMLRSGPHLI